MRQPHQPHRTGGSGLILIACARLWQCLLMRCRGRGRHVRDVRGFAFLVPGAGWCCRGVGEAVGGWCRCVMVLALRRFGAGVCLGASAAFLDERDGGGGGGGGGGGDLSRLPGLFVVCMERSGWCGRGLGDVRRPAAVGTVTCGEAAVSDLQNVLVCWVGRVRVAGVGRVRACCRVGGAAEPRCRADWGWRQGSRRVFRAAAGH